MISRVPFLLSFFAKRFSFFLIEALFIQLNSFLMFYLFIFWTRQYICMASALKNTKRYPARSSLLTRIPIQPNFSPQRQSILSVSYMFLEIFQVYRSKYVLIVTLSFSTTKKIPNKTGYQFWPFLFNIVLKVIASARRQEKEVKHIQIRKNKISLSLSPMTWYLCKTILYNLKRSY